MVVEVDNGWAQRDSTRVVCGACRCSYSESKHRWFDYVSEAAITTKDNENNRTSFPILLLPRAEFKQIADQTGYYPICRHPERLFAQTPDGRCGVKNKKPLKERNAPDSQSQLRLILDFLHNLYFSTVVLPTLGGIYGPSNSSSLSKVARSFCHLAKYDDNNTLWKVFRGALRQKKETCCMNTLVSSSTQLSCRLNMKRKRQQSREDQAWCVSKHSRCFGGEVN